MKNLSNKLISSCFIATALLLAGCASSMDQVLSAKGSVELRSMQTRSFDTLDKQQTMRSVVSTLQDLNFVIDKADMDLGTVSATKLSGYEIRMTVTVRKDGPKSMQVRANAQYNAKAIETPEPYQDFFASLEKSMFLTANQVG